MRTSDNKQRSAREKKDTGKTPGLSKVFSVCIPSKANNAHGRGTNSAVKISKSWKKRNKGSNTRKQKRNGGTLLSKTRRTANKEMESLAYKHSRAKKHTCETHKGDYGNNKGRT